MAQYNFEGDFTSINERQLEFINKVILEQDAIVNKVFFEPFGQIGDNFVANMKRITIESINGTLQMIAKVAPSHEGIRLVTNATILFMNEHIMYTEVLPKFVQLQKSAGVPEEEQLRYAKCYGSLNEAPHEIILLEDLKASDFVMLNKFESLSDLCVKSILKNLAILHSLSFVLKNKEPETFEQFKGKLFNMWTIMASDEFTAIMQNLENDILSIFDDNSHKNVVKNKLADIGNNLVKLSKYEDGNRHSVIQQGDAWTNNMMFKFEEDKLVQSIMIDYQMSKNTNPVVDILQMIFNCTDYEARSKHFYNWIDYYHSELDKSLSNFGLKANYIYSRDHLDADIKRYGKVLFGLSVISASAQMRDSKEAGELLEAMKTDLRELAKSSEIKNLQDKTVLRLKDRVVGLIDSYKEFGLL